MRLARSGYNLTVKLIWFVKVIAAKGEQKASGALRAAAETMEQAPAALQLRFLQVHKKTCFCIFKTFFQTLSSISAEKNHTFVFPLPIDLVKGILGRDGEEEDPDE